MMHDPAMAPLSMELLDRYLAGECSAEEAARVRAMVARDPELGGTVGVLLAMKPTGDGRPVETDVPRYWQQFMAEKDRVQVGAKTEALVAKRGHPAGELGRGRFFKQSLPLGKQTSRGRMGYWLSLTGAMLVSIVGIHVLVHSGPGPFQKQQARSYITIGGQQATVTLADGSRALLGPETKLIVTTQPSDAGMDVQVIGQALFTAAHRQDRPFRVHAGNAVVRVLGTTFMVRRYPADHIARVVVTEGRVSLSSVRGAASRRTGRVLLASMMGTVDDSGKVQVSPAISDEDYTSWTTGHLVFDKTPARNAVTELGRAYGVDIHITDSALANQRLTCTIPITRWSLTLVLENLADVLDAHSVRTGRIITLVPGRSASSRPIGSPFPNASERQYGK